MEKLELEINNNIKKYYKKELNELNELIINELKEYEFGKNIIFNELFKLKIFKEISNTINKQESIEKINNTIKNFNDRNLNILNRKINFFYINFKIKNIFKKDFKIKLELEEYEKFFHFEHINFIQYFETIIKICLIKYLEDREIFIYDKHYNGFYYYMFKDISLNIISYFKEKEIDKIDNYINDFRKKIDYEYNDKYYIFRLYNEVFFNKKEEYFDTKKFLDNYFKDYLKLYE